MRAILFIILIISYALYEELTVFQQKEETLGGLLVIGYVFALVHICFLIGFSIHVHLWSQLKKRSIFGLLVEKAVFVYVLLLWRHKYNPIALGDNAVSMVLAILIIALWLTSSSSISRSVVSFTTQSLGEKASPMLVPGKTPEQRLFNSSMLTALITVLPAFFWGVDYIFAKQ